MSVFLFSRRCCLKFGGKGYIFEKQPLITAANYFSTERLRHPDWKLYITRLSHMPSFQRSSGISYKREALTIIDKQGLQSFYIDPIFHATSFM